MTSITHDRLMTAAMLAGVPAWIAVEYWAGYGALGLIAGAAVSLALMLTLYAVGRARWRRTIARRSRYRLRGHT